MVDVEKPGVPLGGGSLGGDYEVGTLFGYPPLGKLSDLIIHVLAYLLQGGGQLLGLILGQSPTAAG